MHFQCILKLVNYQGLTKYCREFLLNDEQISNVDDYCEVFSNLLKNGIQRSKHKKSFRKFSRQLEPWYTPKYLELVKVLLTIFGLSLRNSRTMIPLGMIIGAIEIRRIS